MGQEEGQLSRGNNEIYQSNGKINRHFFEFQYIIGKGGFGKVNNKSHIIYYSI
jgi:hypothetical protein